MKIRFASLARRAAALGLIACALPALAAAAPLPGDNFEADDGNLVLNTGGNVDWNTASPSVSFDAPQASDNSFTNGAQEDKPSSTWGTTAAPVNSKADIARVYMKSAFPFFRLGIVRNQAANGTVAFHVELNQSSAKHANGLPVRTVGDALFVYDVQGNDTTATIKLHRWIGAGACVTNTAAPCWGPGATMNATQAIGANHAGPLSTLDAVADPDVQLAAKTFDELAVNLSTALGVPENSCINFGQVWVKTREGGSFGSALQDLMGPLPISVGNCDVAIEKDVVKVDDASIDNPASVSYGSVLEYRVRVFLGPGSAPVPASLLSVTDTSISDNTLDEAPLAPVIANGDIVGDANGNEILEAGEKWVYALNSEGAPVVQVAASCEDVVNSAKVAVTGGDTNPANNHATRTTGVVCTPDLAIDKWGPESVDFGDTITYAITVRHTDASDPLGIPVQTVTDKVGAGTGVALSLLGGDDGDDLLEKGEVWTYGTNDGPMTVIPETCDDVVNTVTLAASMDTNAENDSDSVTTNVVCKPDLVIDKWAPASVRFGDTITYAINVSHAPGSDPLAIPVDSVMDELAGQSAIALSLLDGDDGNGKLDMGETWTYGTGNGPFTYTPATCDDVVNTVTLAASMDTNAENDSDSVTTKVVCKPDLVIEKYAEVERIDFGGKITYTITVRHTSASDPLSIPVQSVTDKLGDAAAVGLTLAGGDGNANMLLDKGEVWTYGLANGPVTHTADRCAPVVNTVKLTADGDSNVENNTDHVTVPVTCTLDIGIAKTSDKDVYVPGDTINYTITVTNTGQAAIPFGQIAVNDPTLPQLTPVNPPAELASGASVEFTGSRAVTTADCGQVRNTATASLRLDGQVVEETDSTNNTAHRDVTVKCTLDVAIAKSADKPSYAPGEAINYTVTVTNTGQLPIPFAAIKVSDPTLPALTLSGAAPQALAPGQALVYTGARQVTAAQCGQVVNTATVALTGDLQAEVTLLDNTASVAVAVAGAACSPVVIGEVDTRIAIRKVGPRKGKVKQAVAYTILVTNTGATVAKNVMVVDPLPAGMVIAKRPANATFNKGRLTWTVGDLKPGQSVTLRVLLRTDVNLTRTRCNVATASASNAPTVRGRACTRFTKVLGATIVPRVTG